MKKALFLSQSVIQFLVAIGALISGFLLMLFPSGSTFQFPEGTLKDTPFANFFVPGVILFTINGCGQLAAGILTLRHHPWSGFVGSIVGIGMMIWIFVQVNMIGGKDTLQYTYFFIGVLETALAFLIQGLLPPTRHAIARSPSLSEL